jgi:thioesterase domain-containing protein/NADP-dependent 3-hydroxy acid dehydrogenase YdfG/acyl carrier protein
VTEATPASTFGAGTTLIAGASGNLGRLLARHLVVQHGVRHLLLTSRSGIPTALVDELTELGATVTAAACDVSDRRALAGLLAAIPAEHPLSAVLHLAVVVDNAAIGSLSEEQLAAALRPKVDGALALADLTEGYDLTAFVLFSSAAGLLGSAGQGNYAAGNAFVDGLAAQRRWQGKPAQSIAWGPWANALTDAASAQLTRAGMAALSDVEGLELFDAAVARPEALLAPMKIVMAKSADAEDVPHLFRALVAPSRRTATRARRSDAATVQQQLAALPTAQREKALRELVLDHTSALLGYADADAIDPHRHFLELGFDSLTAVDLRNRVNAATGLRLPPTATFDLQNPAALAAHLAALLGDVGAAGAGPARAAAPDDPTSHVLKHLFGEAVRAGKVSDGLALLGSVANLRPSFESISEVDMPPVPVRLSEGSQHPHLLCFATPVAMRGIYQYARVAAHFRGLRDVSAFPMPGFLAEERLPASGAAAVDLLTECARKAVDDRPFALLGYSSAGILAYAVAAGLEKLGNRPVAVVLLDTYPVSGPDVARSGQEVRNLAMADMAVEMLERESRNGAFDTTKLTAMARYTDILPHVALTDITAPTLLLRPERRFSVGSWGTGPVDGDTNDWRTNWSRANVTRTVPGDHFSIVAEDSETTARAIHDWLDVL